MNQAPQGFVQSNSQQGNQQHHTPQGFSQQESYQGYQQHAPQGITQQGHQQNHSPQGISQNGTRQHSHGPQGISQNGTSQHSHGPQGISQNRTHQHNHGPQGISQNITQNTFMQQTFQVFVKNFADGKNYTFDVTNTTTVDDLKTMIQNRLPGHLPADLQRLTYAGKNLDKGTMKDNNVQANQTILLVVRVVGG